MYRIVLPQSPEMSERTYLHIPSPRPLHQLNLLLGEQNRLLLLLHLNNLLMLLRSAAALLLSRSGCRLQVRLFRVLHDLCD